MATDPQQPIQLPVSWVGADELQVLWVNQFLVQTQGPNEFTVTIGQLVGPPLVGSPEEQAAQAREIAFVPVQGLFRMGLTRTRLVELIQVLQIQLERHDQQMAREDPTGGAAG